MIEELIILVCLFILIVLLILFIYLNNNLSATIDKCVKMNNKQVVINTYLENNLKDFTTRLNYLIVTKCKNKEGFNYKSFSLKIEELYEYKTNIYFLNDENINFKITDIEFDLKTRKLKINIIQTTIYKTIERYVQRNYVKKPIYSKSKEKTKKIIKILILKNNDIDELINNSDQLILKMSFEIISYLIINFESIYIPYWYKKIVIIEEKRLLLKQLNEDIFSLKKEVNYLNELLINILKSSKNSIKNKKVFRLEKKYNKLKYNKDNKKFIVINKSLIQIEDTKQKYDYLKNELNNIKYIFNNNNLNSEIDNLSKDIKIKIEDHYKNREYELIEYNDKETPSEVFIPLVDIYALSSDKIIGCYIIRNIENNKVYVGQSKDILKRIKSHFNGTVPKNIIFSEDYYTTSFDKNNLFEICIIDLGEKGQLDDYEKALISKYNSFKNGYNRTSGNI